MRKLAILGASGHGKVVADTALQAGWDEVIFFDDTWPSLKMNGNLSVAGDAAKLLECRDEFLGVVVAIGNNRVRLNKTMQLREAGLPLVTLVHPKAYVANDVVIEPGTVVFAGAIVQPGGSIGLAGIVNTGATIDHDCVLRDGVHVCPGAHLAGGVMIDECTWVGIGAVVNQYLRIGSGVTIGAGAAVVGDVPVSVTVVGVPGRVVTRS